jgi:hypothetical protein
MSLTSVIPDAVLNTFDEYSLQDLLLTCEFGDSFMTFKNGYTTVKEAAESAPHGRNGTSACSPLVIEVIQFSYSTRLLHAYCPCLMLQ